MSRTYINSYFNDLEGLRRAGALTEPTMSQAFGAMLKDWGRARNLIFLQQHPVPGRHGRNVIPDGVLVHDIRVRFGLWEAKHDGTDIDAEIAAKRKRGYPLDNIVFENTRTAVLYQHDVEAMRADMADADALERLLTLFFAYERREIADWRRAVETFRHDLPAVLDALRASIARAYETNPAFRAKAAAFLGHCREAINPAVTEADVREMLIQHILTEDIFNAVFDNTQFHRENNVARKLYDLEAAFFTGAVKHEAMAALRPYYAAIRQNAAAITEHAEKQTFLKVIYESFYKVYDPKKADRLGVVYTPNEIVRFMVEGADWLCREHFGKGLIDPGVDILDPACGTGTFVVELLNFFRGQPKEAIYRKYTQELHANEVAILPYYVANLNIEATYADIAGQYAEYPNLCFVDTLDNVAALGLRRGHQHDLFATVSEENARRVKAQNARSISVVIGNPPYNANQQNENDNNKNRDYKRIDETIRSTYVAQSTAQKTKVYDMYARFYRWATDRLEDDGVIAFVTNRSFIETRTFDGFRKCMTEDFAEIRIVDLGGDVRADPRISGTKHNVFGIQTGVAIAFLIKKKRQKERRLFYVRRPELETRDDKLAWLGATRLRDLAFERVHPDKANNWINQAKGDWSELISACDKATKNATYSSSDRALFKLYTLGVVTNRDEWVTSLDYNALSSQVLFFINKFNGSSAQDYMQSNQEIKWTRLLKKIKEGKGSLNFDESEIRYISYRPFTRRHIYFSSKLNEFQYQTPDIWPHPSEPNEAIAFVAEERASFSALGISCLVNKDFFMPSAAQLLPRYRYTPSGERLDNITDWGLAQFEKRYGKGAVTKDAIFAYVYAALHDPVWRETYAINLRREFPRIPFHPDFAQWAAWGRTLLDLHIGYETAEPWPLTRRDTPGAKARAAGPAAQAGPKDSINQNSSFENNRPHLGHASPGPVSAPIPRPILKSDPAARTVTLDTETVLGGFPPECWEYRLGNRCGIDWVLDQHKEKTPKDPTIRERFNTYRFADHKEKVADLLARVARVSVETMAILAAMRAAQRGKD